jgi:hypothetical protein
MEFREILQVINSLLALLAVYPSLKLIETVIKERKIVVKPKQKEINKILTYCFIGVALGALINAFIAINSLTGNSLISHEASPFRSLFTNFFFFGISWLLYTFQKNIKKG